MDSFTETSSPVQQVNPANGAVGETANPAPRYQLRRSRSNRMLGGVCGGLAKALDVDANLVRIGMVAFSIVTSGGGVVLYALAWMFVPEEDA